MHGLDFHLRNVGTEKKRFPQCWWVSMVISYGSSLKQTTKTKTIPKWFSLAQVVLLLCSPNFCSFDVTFSDPTSEALEKYTWRDPKFPKVSEKSTQCHHHIHPLKLTVITPENRPSSKEMHLPTIQTPLNFMFFWGGLPGKSNEIDFPGFTLRKGMVSCQWSTDQQMDRPHMSHEKKTLLLSMKYWLVNRYPGILIMVYEIIPIYLGRISSLI